MVLSPAKLRQSELEQNTSAQIAQIINDIEQDTWICNESRETTIVSSLVKQNFEDAKKSHTNLHLEFLGSHMPVYKLPKAKAVSFKERRFPTKKKSKELKKEELIQVPSPKPKAFKLPYKTIKQKKIIRSTSKDSYKSVSSPKKEKKFGQADHNEYYKIVSKAKNLMKNEY